MTRVRSGGRKGVRGKGPKDAGLTGQLLHAQLCSHLQVPALAQEQEPEELQEHAILDAMIHGLA